MAKKEYIDKLALLQFLKDEIKQCEDDYGDDYEEDDYYTQAVDSRMTAMRHVKHRVELSPAADVVEVVRCKDCQYYLPVSPACGNCFRTTVIQRPKDFCSRGERKEDTP